MAPRSSSPQPQILQKDFQVGGANSTKAAPGAAMKGYGDRLNLARRWRSWKESILKAQITIQERLLANLRTELADLRKLDDTELAMTFGWQSKEDLAPWLKDQRTWRRMVEDMWIAAEMHRKAV